MEKETPLISGCGQTVVDILLLVDKLIISQKNPALTDLIQVGGVVPTALMTAARLGVKTHLYTSLGKDPLSEMVQSAFKKENIEFTLLPSPSRFHTPISVVVIDKSTGDRTGLNGERHFSEINASDLNAGISPLTHVLIVDGHNPHVSKKYIELAKNRGIQVILDLGNPKPEMVEIMRLSDIIIVPEGYWGVMWPDSKPEEIVKNLLSHGQKDVVLTMGKKGSYIGTKEEIFHQDAYDVKVVDTNGAGDIFLGAFAYGLSQKWDLKKTARFAAGTAAYSCERYGKENKLPHSVSEIEAYLDMLENRS